MIRPDTSVVSIMAINNEIGVKQPISEIGEIFPADVSIFVNGLIILQFQCRARYCTCRMSTVWLP